MQVLAAANTQLQRVERALPKRELVADNPLTACSNRAVKTADGCKGGRGGALGNTWAHTQEFRKYLTLRAGVVQPQRDAGDGETGRSVNFRLIQLRVHTLRRVAEPSNEPR